MSTQNEVSKISFNQGKTLLQKLESFSDFPQFWEEEYNDWDPAVKEAQDKEVEDFKARLEEMNKNATKNRIPFANPTSALKLKELYQDRAAGQLSPKRADATVNHSSNNSSPHTKANAQP